jgi:hypothetical protein
VLADYVNGLGREVVSGVSRRLALKASVCLVVVCAVRKLAFGTQLCRSRLARVQGDHLSERAGQPSPLAVIRLACGVPLTAVPWLSQRYVARRYGLARLRFSRFCPVVDDWCRDWCVMWRWWRRAIKRGCQPLCHCTGKDAELTVAPVLLVIQAPVCVFVQRTRK